MVFLMLLVNTLLDEPCYIFTITNSLAISVATWKIKDFPSLCSNLWKQIVAPEQSVRITHMRLLNSVVIELPPMLHGSVTVLNMGTHIHQQKLGTK